MNNATLDQLKALKLEGMAHAYSAFMNLPVNQQPGQNMLLDQLLEAEAEHRITKKKNMYVRLSKLRYQANVYDIDCSEQRNLSKDQLAKFIDCRYIQKAQNVLITGATGCGKSYLACALGHQACAFGHRTLYFNMNRFIEQLALSELDGSKIKWFNRLNRAALIILDDFGLQPLNHNTLLALLQILEDRYGRYSTIICSQLPYNKWYEYINEPTLADAILDRLLSNAHKIDLEGKSLRKSSI